MDAAGDGEAGIRSASRLEAWTLAYVKQIAGGNVPCDAGSPVPCSAVTRRGGMGWGWEEGQEAGTCAFLWLIHVRVWQKSGQSCDAVILQLKVHT